METFLKERKKPPLLMVSHGSEYDIHTFFDVSKTESDKKSVTTPLDSLKDRLVLGSDFGWFVLVDNSSQYNEDYECFYPPLCWLWHPEKLEMIKLPRLEESYIYNRCVLSKPPTDPDCLVVFNSCTNFKQSVCRPGDDTFIKTSSSAHGQLVAMSSFQGEVYGIIASYRGCHYFVTLHLVGETVEYRPILINGEPFSFSTPTMRQVRDDDLNYLIPCGVGEFFFVTKIICNPYKNDDWVRTVEKTTGIIEYAVELNNSSDSDSDDVSDDSDHGRGLYATDEEGEEDETDEDEKEEEEINDSDEVFFRVHRVNFIKMTCSEELEDFNFSGMSIFVSYNGNGFCCSSESAKTKPDAIYDAGEKGRIVTVYMGAGTVCDWVQPLKLTYAKMKKSFNCWVPFAI